MAGILSRKWFQSRRADGGARRRFLGLGWDANRSEVMGKKFASLMRWLMLVISWRALESSWKQISGYVSKSLPR